MEISDDSLKISVFLKDKDNLLANVTISIFTIDYGFVTIKDFQIWVSRNFNERLQEAINITPPMKNFYGKYHQRVFLENKDKWYQLEARIYDAYCLSRNKEKKTEKVNLDELPI